MRKKVGQRKPRKGPVPDALIRSQRPNENIEWCANCQAHTRRTNKHGSTGSLWEKWGRAARSGGSGYTWKGGRCSHCYSSLLWNVPVEIRKVTYGCGGCGLFLVVGIGSLCVAAGLFAEDFETAALVVATVLLPLYVLILGPVFWFFYLHSCWIKWLNRQPVAHAAAVSTSAAPQQRAPSQMSVEDMLAAARAEVSGKTAAAPPALEDASLAEETPSSKAGIADTPQVERDSMSIDEILAHCRKVDG